MPVLEAQFSLKSYDEEFGLKSEKNAESIDLAYAF
jgi:hypothetical protein